MAKKNHKDRNLDSSPDEIQEQIWNFDESESTDPTPMMGAKKKSHTEDSGPDREAQTPKKEDTPAETPAETRAETAEEKQEEKKWEARERGVLNSLRERLSNVRTTRWIRFGIVSILFFLFVIWIGNPWISIFWLLLIDLYLTAYIPWSWWRNKTGFTRRLLSWIDAIIYALVLVYIIFAFIGQNYKIPSSSLEKSLLVGDYLWVNKTTYGPRVPNTPLHFPLAQHTMPFLGTKSYIEHPQLAYHRLPGFRDVERGDIVVFNFPEGDTVLSRIPDADYYMIAQSLRENGITDPLDYIRRNQNKFGEIIVRPVDRRENYVKRVVGLPGDRLQITNDTVYINGKPISFADNVQFNYIIPVSRAIPDEKWLELGVRREDHGGAPVQGNELAGYKYYTVPLTAAMKKEIEKWPEVAGPLRKENIAGFYEIGNVWPLGNNWRWTRSNTDEFWIPKRGKTLHVTLDNLPLYRRAIETYEGNKVEVKNGKIYINGSSKPYYTFKYDYYWMMGDNRDRSLDSRYFGLVPEDHIVGTPQRIMFSIDEERSIMDLNKIRWDRIFANPNPDKDKAEEKNWK